jgi:tetratricopeptide (TPR) repeat protein
MSKVSFRYAFLKLSVTFFLLFFTTNCFCQTSQELLEKSIKDLLANSNIDDKHLAVIMQEKALRKAKFLNNYQLSIDVYYELIPNLQSIGDNKKAMELCIEALKLIEKKKDKSSKGAVLLMMGNIYLELKDIVHARERYNNAINLFSELKVMKNLAISFNNLAVTFDIEENYDSSLYYYYKSLEINKTIKDTNVIAMLTLNIGDTYTQLKQYGKGLEMLTLALTKFSVKDDSKIICFLAIGENYFKQKKLDSALKYFTKGKELSNEQQNLPHLLNSYDFLLKVYRIKKDYLRGFEMQDLYYKLNDSILGSEKNTAIFELDKKYNYEKKQKDIELLSKEKALQNEKIKRFRRDQIGLFAGLGLIMIIAGLLYRQFRQKRKANIILEEKNEHIETQSQLLEHKNKMITDSINYANNIQKSILPNDKLIQILFKDSFVLFKPKDIVSGDFYWLEQKEKYVYFSVIDCTGHGVPGAFMTIFAFNMLDNCMEEFPKATPEKIIEYMSNHLYNYLKTRNADVSDAMELVICRWDTDTGELLFSGAFNSLYHISAGELKEFKGGIYPIGDRLDNKFELERIMYKPGDSLYLFTDGYCDQKGKKEILL